MIGCWQVQASHKMRWSRKARLFFNYVTSRKYGTATSPGIQHFGAEIRSWNTQKRNGSRDFQTKCIFVMQNFHTSLIRGVEAENWPWGWTSGSKIITEGKAVNWKTKNGATSVVPKITDSPTLKKIHCDIEMWPKFDCKSKYSYFWSIQFFLNQFKFSTLAIISYPSHFPVKLEFFRFHKIGNKFCRIHKISRQLLIS